MKDVAVSVLARLKNQAKEAGMNYQMCLQLFCQEELLRRLSMSKYNNNFILKGGLFIYTLTEFQSRATKDIDFLMRYLSNDVEEVKKIMEEICSISTLNDYIKLETLNTEIITPEKEYHGVSLNLLGLIKNVRIPFSIDVGFGDVIVPQAEKRMIQTRLSGFEAPNVYTYSLESTIAEKFEAILRWMEATSRMKDFFDIYYLSSIFDFEGIKLQEAVWKTIQNRKTDFTEDCFNRIVLFSENTFLTTQWIRFQPIMQKELPEFDIVLTRLKKFLQPVFEASIRKETYSMAWSAELKKWR